MAAQYAFPLPSYFWDWNGTLLDDVALSVLALNSMLQRFLRPPVTIEWYRENFSFPVRDFYASLGFDLAEIPFPVLSRTFHEQYRSGLAQYRLQRDAVDILRGFAARGLSQHILSSYPHADLLHALQMYGVEEYFNHVVGVQAEGGSSKVANGLALLQELQCTADEAVLIGDTEHDHEVATTLGIDCILIAHGYQSQARLLPLGVPV